MLVSPTMQGSHIVRYGRMRALGAFEATRELVLKRGDNVVVRTDRGTEIGEVLCEATQRASAFLESPTIGPVLRRASEDDTSLHERIQRASEDCFSIGLEHIAKRRLQMKLVDVEGILGGERLIFYYLADQRVDFRELVKDFAREFRTRIEMRQIGVRDEAKLLADYGDCGKPVCCNTHLTRMPPVTMRMAKQQKSTLDPAKISGRCGRLKCCLRYEFEHYQELEQALPPVGTRVTSNRGKGRVEAAELLAQKVLVELDDGRRILLDRDEITIIQLARGRGTTDLEN